MKKILLAGVFIIIALGLFIFYGKISHLPWEGLPGHQPREIWSRERGDGEILAAAERKGMILVGRKNQGFSLLAMDYQGNEAWQKASRKEGSASLGKEYWAAAEYDRGSVEIFDYQGSRVSQIRIPPDFKKIWMGPAGEVISIYSLFREGNDKEDLYGEKLRVFSPEGRTIFNQDFSGQGVLEVKIVPGKEILIVNTIEVYPQAKSKVYLVTLEGETLAEVESSELFFSPLLCLQEEEVFLATKKEFFAYSFTGDELVSRFMDFEIIDILMTGKGELVLFALPGTPSPGSTRIKGLDEEGLVIWEKKVPGTYQRSQGRQDGGFYLLTEENLYLFYPRGESYYYYSLEENKEVYPLSGEVFFLLDGQDLKGYYWPLSTGEKERNR